MRNLVIYEKDKYKILLVKGRYVVYNSSKDFQNGHTHINKYKIAKLVLNCCISKTVSGIKSDYLLLSIIRISDDEEFKEKVKKIRKIRARERKYE